MVSCLIFKSFSHFEFIFGYSVRVHFNFTDLHVAFQLSQHCLLKRQSFFFTVCSSLLCRRLSDCRYVSLFLDSLICSTDAYVSFVPVPIEIKAKIKKWDLMKLQSFCTAKETINKTKRQLMEWEKIFANKVTDKGLISKIYKQLIQLTTTTIKKTQLKNGQKTLTDISPKMTYRWPIGT